MDLSRLTASEAAVLIKKKKITSVQLTESCLERIHERNDVVGAFKFINPDFSLKQAQYADSTSVKSILHGVPFGVKDVIDTKDFPTERGTKIHQGRRPVIDASCVNLMRKAGAVLLGKLVSTEYAMFTPNETRHPLNTGHTPGGSSSGTGAAVADNMVPIAFGNQTAGSLIRPAAFCGVYGLKPTHGTTDGYGILPLQPYFDTLGYMARSIEDIQNFYGLVTSQNQTVIWPNDRAPRIGVCETHQWPFAEQESRTMLETVAKHFDSSGSQVEYFKLPDDYSELVELHRLILYRGISHSLADDYNSSKELMSKGLVEVIEEGLSHNEEDYRCALIDADRFRAQVNQTFANFDAIICPSTPGEAPQGMGTGSPIFQVTWTLLGVPCINLPTGFGPKGLPVGVQLVGRRFDDARLLALAAHLMQEFNTIKI